MDPLVRERYFDRWIESLNSVSKVTVPPNACLIHFLYVSADKSDELSRINKFFEDLEPPIRSRFKLVTYSHPTQGYGFDDATHPDMLKNPNKIAPRRDALFKKALDSHEIPTHDRTIRITLDDDDLWLPWHLKEVVAAADKTYEPGQIIGVGLENAVIAYLDEQRADVVGLTRAMNGNKFYVSDRTCWEKQINLSPWSIPESFDATNIDRLARSGVSLKWISANQPGWVYGRWGSNLSGREKQRYYAQELDSFKFGSIDEIAARTATSQKTITKSNAIAPNHTSADRLANSFRVFVPESFHAGEGSLFSVFRAPDGSDQAVYPVERGKEFDLNRLGHFERAEDWIVYLQLRTPTGDRFDVSPRARLSSLNEIKALAASDFDTSIDFFDAKYLEKLTVAFSLSEWIHRADVSDHLESLLALPPKSTPSSGEGIALLSYLVGKTGTVPGSRTHAALTQASKLRERSDVIGNAETDHEKRTLLTDTKLAMGTAGAPQQHEFKVGDSIVEYELDPNPGHALLVFLHGRKSNKVKLPYFVGKGVSSKHAVSRLSISDPSLTLSPDNSIAWYAGNKFQPRLQEQLVTLVRAVQKEVDAPRIVFAGGSAGGFASLALAHSFPNSIALVWNPQTDIFEYYKGFVDQYIRTCWDGNPYQLKENAIYSVCQSYREPTEATVLYMQEPTDEFHFEQHMKPFIENCVRGNNTFFYTSHWGEGHVPPPKHLLHQVIDAAISPDPVSSARNLGFRTAEELS